MAAAVNAPVNEKVKERDVNNKLQLYGIYSGAFAPACVCGLANRLRCSIRKWQGPLGKSISVRLRRAPSR